MNYYNKLTDRELYSLCLEWGENARKWTNKFASLLPEVNRRGLFKTQGYHTIYEFAAKLGGMNNNAVDEVLRVSKKLEDKPALQSLLRDYGWSKLRVVASIATTENQNLLAEKVKAMSKSVLETFVREAGRENLFSDKHSSLGLTTDLPAFLPGEEFTTISFRVSVKTETSLRIFRQKLEKIRHEAQSFEQVIETLLETAQKHENCVHKAKRAPSRPDAKPALPAKRYIPASIRHAVDKKYQGRCAFPHCKNAADSYHHTKRFALSASHDPRYLVPLCASHERLAHHGLINNEESAPETWKIQLNPDKNSQKYAVDLKVQKFRKTH